MRDHRRIPRAVRFLPVLCLKSDPSVPCLSRPLPPLPPTVEPPSSPRRARANRCCTSGARHQLPNRRCGAMALIPKSTDREEPAGPTQSQSEALRGSDARERGAFSGGDGPRYDAVLPRGPAATRGTVTEGRTPTRARCSPEGRPQQRARARVHPHVRPYPSHTRRNPFRIPKLSDRERGQ